MIRVYLDWNIFTFLKQQKQNDKVDKSLFTFINDNIDRLLIPYSSAHLQDLNRGFPDNQTYTYSDLGFLQELSRNQCLYEDYNQRKVIPIIKEVTEFFSEINGAKIQEEIDLNTLVPVEDNLYEKWAEYIELLKSTSSTIDFDQLDSIPSKYGSISGMFQDTRVNNNLFSLINDVLRFVNQPEKHSAIYKSSRNAAIDDMKIETDSRVWGNAFDYLNNFFSKAKLNQTVSTIVEGNLDITHKDNKRSKYDYFVNYYLSLDRFGYYRDDKLPNLICDAIHAYFGAYCDFYVTDDDKAYHKTKAVYDHLNIETTVCKSSDFLSGFYSKYRYNNNDCKNVLERIEEIIGSPVVLMNTIDNNSNPVKIHEVTPFIFDYFNRIQISDLIDCRVIYLYKKKANYSDFMFWDEIKSVVDKVVLYFGVDANGRTEFDGQDKNELSVGEWKGRIWDIYDNLIEIEKNESVGLSLIITMNKAK